MSTPGFNYRPSIVLEELGSRLCLEMVLSGTSVGFEMYSGLLLDFWRRLCCVRKLGSGDAPSNAKNTDLRGTHNLRMWYSLRKIVEASETRLVAVWAAWWIIWLM